MKNSNRYPKLLPEVSLDWPALKSLARHDDKGHDDRQLSWIVTVSSTVLGLISAISFYGAMSSHSIWMVFAGFILMCSMIAGFVFGLIGIGRILFKRFSATPTPQNLASAMKWLLAKRVHKLIGPRTAPGRAHAARENALVRLDQIRRLRLTTSDPANDLVLHSIMREIQDLDETGAMATWRDVKAAEAELLEVVNNQVVPRATREHLLVGAILSAGDRVTTRIGMKARTTAVLETSASAMATERHRVEMAAHGSVDEHDLDANVATVMKKTNR